MPDDWAEGSVEALFLGWDPSEALSAGWELPKGRAAGELNVDLMGCGRLIYGWFESQKDSRRPFGYGGTLVGCWFENFPEAPQSG